MRLYSRRVLPWASRMQEARRRASPYSSSGGTSRLARPHLAADSPLRGAPVKDTSFARAAPTSRGSFCERPQEGAMPRRQCQSMNRASLLTRTMSAAKAISKPALTQAPWTHAMMGAGHCSIHLATTASGRAPPSRAGALPNTWETALRSTPEQKEGPSPIKMTQPTDASAERAWKAAPSWLSISKVRALRASGRLIVTVTRPGSSASARTRIRSAPAAPAIPAAGAWSADQ
mmetsp:Transcript_12355/g.45072  ORF Transcript_12355/g.45072 Transcript_12355/m.45072 type:complete len:232 (+) Transcript_12355:2320-3015(+)